MLSLLCNLLVEVIDSRHLASTRLNFGHAHLRNQVDPYRVTLELLVHLDFLIWLELGRLLVLLEQHLTIRGAEFKHGLNEVVLFKLAHFPDLGKSQNLILVEEGQDAGLVAVDLDDVLL